jgi:hypothetical protein
MAKVNVGLKVVDIDAFLATVQSGITQSNNDATVIETAITLGDLRPVLEHLNDRQRVIMKALKILAQEADS